MKKNWLAAIIICFLTLPASSQTLFTYGKYKTDASDFLRAFNKNNQQSAGNRGTAIREYLDLYINSRLKIREAYDKGYDTLPQIRAEVDNLRSQIVENYMSDPKANDRLTKEAFQRSLKDIHVAHIFIAEDANTDTAVTRRKLSEVEKRLAKGEDFQAVAQEYSNDPSVRENKGDINYITVFTLPYEFESIIYNTPVGKYSRPYHSKTGWHIFKNLGERKALGKAKIQQILIAIPPNADETTKRKEARLADSIYQRLAAGDDIAKLANIYSNDVISAAAGGNVPEISVGQFDPAFEKLIWSMKDNTLNKPFLSANGYHIIKKISVTPVNANPNDKTNLENLKQRVLIDDRWKTSRDFIYETVKRNGFQKYAYSDAALWALSDSILDLKPAGAGRSMNNESPLFKIKDSVFKVSDWINYAQMNRYRSDRNGLKPYPGLMDEFLKNTMYQYYHDHLEDYNEEFNNQMNEFKDGNLFFEIMQQEVWNKAQADSLALVELYQKNHANYTWKPSSEAVIFFCSDQNIAKSLSDQIRKNPGGWKKLAEAMGEKVLADSGRYEWSQLPGVGKIGPKAGDITPITVNTADNTASFSYIMKVYSQVEQRSFNDAKGLVMNDYQNILEQEWIKELRKKYPVTVDQKVLAQIAK